jgi:uncharacterized protein YkwD
MISMMTNRQTTQQTQQPIIVHLRERPKRINIVDDAPHFKSRLTKMGRLNSNHVMVNRCRISEGLNTLTRSKYLDDLASNHAIEMSKKQLIYPLILSNEESIIQNQKSKVPVGQNVHRGYNIQYIQELLEYSKECIQSKRNMLSEDFEEFGMGTAVGDDGLLYMCQLFRSHTIKPINSKMIDI